MKTLLNQNKTWKIKKYMHESNWIIKYSIEINNRFISYIDNHKSYAN